MQYRHGDLLICKVDSIPKGTKKRKTNIILDGEATGHAHRLSGGVVLDLDKDNKVYLRVADGGKVTHEEHNTIALPAGDYVVTRQREYDPYAQAARDVRD